MKKNIQGIQKKQIPTSILVSSTELTMTKAAELRNDKSLITAIASKPLIAKELSIVSVNEILHSLFLRIVTQDLVSVKNAYMKRLITMLFVK